MSAPSKLGRQVKSLRLQRGWSQTRMANWLGVSKSTIIRMEQGGKVLELTQVKIVAKLAELQPQVAQTAVA
jgi:DNA-binding XRE family transcriptional regulator